MLTGDIIPFGEYAWRVLDMRDGAALLITEEIIEKRPYHDTYRDITWAGCSLRKYLNGEFLGRFGEADRSRIISVTNNNPDNPWFGTNGGEDTQDRVFLLDIEDMVCRYFGDSSDKLRNRSPKQSYWFQRKDGNNGRRIATFAGTERRSWWWLRSPGRVGVKAVYIHGDGNIGIQGNNILKGNIGEGECRGGVRPALWLKR